MFGTEGARLAKKMRYGRRTVPLQSFPHTKLRRRRGEQAAEPVLEDDGQSLPLLRDDTDQVRFALLPLPPTSPYRTKTCSCHRYAVGDHKADPAAKLYEGVDNTLEPVMRCVSVALCLCICVCLPICLPQSTEKSSLRTVCSRCLLWGCLPQSRRSL